MEGRGAVSYPRRGALGDDAQSPDTAAYWALHDAAVAAANARAYGTPQQAAAAQVALNRAASSNAARVTAQEQTDTAPGFLEQLQGILTGAGKAAAVGLGLVGLFVFGPPILRILEQRGRRAAR